MADIPKHVVRTVKKHEWIIGNEYSESITARELRDGIFFAQQDMSKMGVKVEMDDAYKVTVGDGQIILSVEVEEK